MNRRDLIAYWAGQGAGDELITTMLIARKRRPLSDHERAVLEDLRKW